MKKTKNGFSLIVILGLVAILMTVSLASLSRSVVNVNISRQEEEQARAFSAAELGLEEALVGGPTAGTVGSGGNEADYIVTSSIVGETETLVYPRELASGETATIWLVNHKADGDFDTSVRYSANEITIYWQRAGSADKTAIEATIIYFSGGKFQAKRFPIDPIVGRPETIDFYSAESGSFNLGGQVFNYRKKLTPDEGTALPCLGASICYAMRLRFLFNSQTQPFAVKAKINKLIPKQGNCYDSAGTVKTSRVTSRIRRCIFYPEFPHFFDYVLYSQSDLAK